MRKLLLFIIVGVAAILIATSIHATTFIYPLNIEFSDDGTEPEGPTPWLIAEISDTGLPANTVRITMSTSGLTDSEFVGEWYFNWDFTSSDLDLLNGITPVPGNTGPPANISFNTDNLNANGSQGAGFDILFDFPQPSANRFDANEIVAYDFLGDGDPILSASSFNVLNTAGYFYSAAHVQAIGESDDSGKIGATAAIPEPGTILLLGAGLASLFGIRRFKFKTS